MEPGEWNTACDSAHCVEVMPTRTRIVVRNGSDAGGHWLYFTHQEWREFVEGAKEGRFDI